MSSMTEAQREDVATRYKRTVAGRYRALTQDEVAAIPPGRLWVSPKVDGELWFAALDGTGATLFARGGRTVDAAPVLDELHAVAQRAGKAMVIAGELFVAGRKPRPRVGDVSAALAGQGLDALGFQAFDVAELEGVAPPADYGERLAILQRALEGGKRAVVVKTEEGGPSLVTERFSEWVASGRAEGLVVRAASGAVFKVKPKFTLDAVVMGFTTRVTEPDQVRSALLGLMRSDGTVQLIGSVGTFPGEDMRCALLAMLMPLECASAFRHASSDGALYRFVRPQLVLEVSCTDLQAEDSAGDPVTHWALRHSDAGWSPAARVPSASLLHPAVVRVRDDKKGDALDVRASQLDERCPGIGVQAPVAPAVLPKSALVRRDVWVKETKGKTAVRKLLVWRTHKEAASPGWPAWVVHFTDYSPDRKTPLERTLRTARTEAEASAVAAALIEENIKKGWNLYAASSGAEPSGHAAAATTDGEAAEKKPPKKAVRKGAKADADADGTVKNPGGPGQGVEEDAAAALAPKKKSAKKKGAT